MSSAEERLQQVYQATSPAELREAYQNWASHYEEDLQTQLGWDKPERVVQVLAELTPLYGPVLEVGIGTGLAGRALHQRGCRAITGLDFSPAMLAQAARPGVYNRLIEHDLSQPLPFADGEFAVALAVGVFTEGHVGPESLSELFRVVRPKGLVAFSLRDDLHESMGFAATLDYLKKNGTCQLHERRRFSDGLEGRPWTCWVYQRG